MVIVINLSFYRRIDYAHAYCMLESVLINVTRGVHVINKQEFKNSLLVVYSTFFLVVFSEVIQNHEKCFDTIVL